MAYTVKQVAAMSGVSVRTLHFYDESGLLKKFTGGGGGPRQRHHDQDEWIYVIDGTIDLVVGETRMRLGAGESVFIPRTVSHGWGCVSDALSKIINVYQPAGRMEEFFRAVGEAKNLPSREQVLEKTYTEKQRDAVHQLFAAHGMDLLGPPHIPDEK